MDDLDAEDPADDMERLARSLLDLGLDLLKRKRRFFPFGAVVWVDGELQLAAAPTRADDGRKLRTDAELLAALEAELGADVGAGRARAAGVCTCGPGAITLHLESFDGVAVTARLGFRTAFPRRIVVDDAITEADASARLFPGAHAAAASRHPQEPSGHADEDV